MQENKEEKSEKKSVATANEKNRKKFVQDRLILFYLKFICLPKWLE